MGKGEKERLEREEFEAKGFVPNLERLLLAVDDSANGKFAERLAGLLAGARGMPMTVLPLSRTGRDRAEDNGKRKPQDTTASDRAGDAAKTAAEDSERTQNGEDPAPPDVTVRKPAAPSEEAVAEEARKGYDLLFIGLKNTRGKDGGFHGDAARVASGFEGPFAVTAGKGVHLEQPERSPLHILVPVNGSEVSRRAADMALAIARACGCPITALYVTAGAASNPRSRRGFRARREEQAIMKDIVEMADHYDVPVKTAMHADVTPDKAILDELKSAEHDLIVLGVSRRPGDKLFFGDTAAAVFEKAPVSVVFLAS
jgi:nucleotide-binding universal stress UspA family protein